LFDNTIQGDTHEVKTVMAKSLLVSEFTWSLGVPSQTAFSLNSTVVFEVQLMIMKTTNMTDNTQSKV